MNEQADNQSHASPHSHADADGSRWMTFNELAEIRGINKLSAVALVRRHGWRRPRDNHRRVIALVPPTWAEPEINNQPHSQNDNEADPNVYRAAFETALAAIEAAHSGELTALRERVDAADRRADRAEKAVIEERALADRLRETIDITAGELAATEKRLRDKLDTTEAVLGIAQRLALEAEQERDRAENAAEALRQAEAERNAKGLLARLRDAWKGK
jgi:hypothetical protein